MANFRGNLTPDNHITLQDENKATNLPQNICPDYVSSPEPHFRPIMACIESRIILHELENSINSNDTAPGHDGISYSMMKKSDIGK